MRASGTTVSPQRRAVSLRPDATGQASPLQWICCALRKRLETYHHHHRSNKILKPLHEQMPENLSQTTTTAGLRLADP